MLKRTKDIPLLSEAEMPKPLDDDRRRSRIERRIKAEDLPGHIDKLNAELAELHDPLVARFQKFLDDLEDEACPTLEENQELARMVMTTADRYGIKLMCGDERQEFHLVRMRCIQPRSTPKDRQGSAAGTFEARTADARRVIIRSSVVWPALRATRKEDESTTHHG
jgi:hypothetical protein